MDANGFTAPTPDEAIEGAAMLRELVQRIDAGLILDPVDIQDVAALGERTGEQPHQGAAKVVSTEGDGVLNVIFELGGSVFSMPAAALAEVQVYEAPMPLPGVPSWLLGIESFRGEVLSITDLAAFLGFSQLVPSSLARILVIFDPRSPKRALTGLAVDAVLTHQWLPETPGGENAAEALGGRLGRFAKRLVELDGRALAELDIEALLGSTEFLQLSD